MTLPAGGVAIYRGTDPDGSTVWRWIHGAKGVADVRRGPGLESAAFAAAAAILGAELRASAALRVALTDVLWAAGTDDGLRIATEVGDVELTARTRCRILALAEIIRSRGHASFARLLG